MVYYWGIVFSSFLIFGVIYMIRQMIVYNKYERLKFKIDPSYKERRHHYFLGDTYTISVLPIKENDKHPVLVKLKVEYNKWIRLWWYVVAIIVGFMIIGGILTTIINLVNN